jgi:hypothetical protein
MRRFGLLTAASLAGLLGALGAALPACNGSDGGGTALVNWNRRPKRDYTFTVSGPLPVNQTVYFSGTRRGLDVKTEGKLLLEPQRSFVVEGLHEGDRWVVRTEPVELSAAERRLLWHFERDGICDAQTELPLDLPERAVVRLTGDPRLERADVITLAHEASGTHGCAIRDPQHGTLQRIWNDAEGAGHYYGKRRNTVRPFAFDDFRAGEYVVAARTEGRQWLARRASLVAGETLDLDTAGAPEGGGKVVCEEGKAVLLLGGELPVPFPRVTEVVYRAVWDGVPPGDHAVLYPGGERRPVTVTDGGELVLPADPPR